MMGYILVFCWLAILVVSIGATTDNEAVIDDSPSDISATSAISDLSEKRSTTTRSGAKLHANKNDQPRRIRGSGSATSTYLADERFEKVRSLKAPIVAPVGPPTKKNSKPAPAPVKPPTPPPVKPPMAHIPDHSDFLHVRTDFNLDFDGGDLDFDLDFDGDLESLLNPQTESPTLEPSQSPSINTRNRYRQLGRKIKVACAGGSLTRGEAGGNPRVYSYPNQLQTLLGDGFDVFNFGRSGATAIRYLDTSYEEQIQFQWAIDKQPDIILIMFGTNDAQYWSTHGKNFQEGLKQVVNSFKNLLQESSPRIILAVPPGVVRDNWGITNNVMRNEVRPRVMEVAIRKGVQLVNMYQKMGIRPSNYLSDGVYLNQEGYRNLALNFKWAIHCNRNGVCEVGETCDACPWDCFVGCPPPP